MIAATLTGPQGLQLLINALLLGGLYTLIGAGFSLVWGIMHIVNIAHGMFVTIGAYITWLLFTRTHIDPFLSLPISMVILFVLGWIIQRSTIHYVVRAPQLSRFFITVAIGLVLENVTLQLFTGNIRSITTKYSGSHLTIGGANIGLSKLAAFAVSLVVVFGFQFFLARTRIGTSIRATGMDVDAARLTGVNVGRTFAVTFALSAMLAGAAGTMLATSQAFSPSSGGSFTVYAFLVSVLGGLGSMVGVMVGSLCLAIIQSFVGFYKPGLANAVAFGLLVIVLFVRPQGLLGKAFSSGSAS
jgi:branched-chain amino acid transport system permease protein